MDTENWNIFLSSCLQLGAVHLANKARKKRKSDKRNVEENSSHLYKRIDSQDCLSKQIRSKQSLTAANDKQLDHERINGDRNLDSTYSPHCINNTKMETRGGSTPSPRCINNTQTEMRGRVKFKIDQQNDDSSNRIQQPTEISINMNSTTLSHSRLQKWFRIRNINLSQQANVLEYDKKENLLNQEVGFAQATDSLNPIWFYFTVKILETGSGCYIAIGLSAKNYPSYTMPGWEDNSVSYHADDGKLYFGSKCSRVIGPALKAGDTIGCGILYDHNHSWIPGSPNARKSEQFVNAYQPDYWTQEGSLHTQVKVFFSLNNNLLGVQRVSLPTNEYYPTIGMLSPKAKVKINLRPTFI